MNQKKEFKGTWFLPSNTEIRISGILIFDPINGAELELYGSFQEMGAIYITPQDNSEFIILGITSDSKPITLYNSFRRKTNGRTFVRNQEAGIPIVSYYSNYVLLGHHFLKEDDLKFTSMNFQLTNLAGWVVRNGFSYDLNSEHIQKKIIEIKYQLPESINFEIDDNCTGKINFSTSTPTLKIPQIKMEIVEELEIEINAKTEISFQEFKSYLSKFQNFLVLALYESTQPMSVQFKNKTIFTDYGELGKIQSKIELFQVNSKNFSKEKSHFEMLFNYPSISSNFSTMMKNWFKKYELLEPAFNLLFEQFYNNSRFTVNTFLNLAQSAETFHARLHNHTRINKTEYVEMKKTILELTPEKYHSWLNDQFNFGNNLNLEVRLTELVKKYNNDLIDEIIIDKIEFVKQVKHSRNYYTHYSTNLKKNALEGIELMRLTDKLKMLLVSAFLHEIGIPKNQISEFFRNARWQIFQHLTKKQ